LLDQVRGLVREQRAIGLPMRTAEPDLTVSTDGASADPRDALHPVVHPHLRKVVPELAGEPRL
jgi:hypothetical protein